ncbi:MAG: hypothetical protein CVU57_02410 [Deltaproteobacteria bacterium HGW-Deltaproteobacteria-15]|jgi:hypothetical protein|nr:MAG: hypothetical protein CVU57_02410 [Deltaproteobacteria bacterium HGW-Deltaproteobacteria-15]
MTYDEVEKKIMAEIRRKGITFQDMTSMASYGVDPHPEQGYEGIMQKLRPNKFNEDLGSERMKELLAASGYNAYDPYPPLKVRFQDLFDYWWNKCVQRELVLDEILDDIFDHLIEVMRPPQAETPTIDLTLDFDHLDIFTKEPPEQVERSGSHEVLHLRNDSGNIGRGDGSGLGTLFLREGDRTRVRMPQLRRKVPAARRERRNGGEGGVSRKAGVS